MKDPKFQKEKTNATIMQWRHSICSTKQNCITFALLSNFSRCPPTFLTALEEAGSIPLSYLIFQPGLINCPVASSGNISSKEMPLELAVLRSPSLLPSLLSQSPDRLQNLAKLWEWLRWRFNALLMGHDLDIRSPCWVLPQLWAQKSN